ncbi:MAG: glycosyltransferase [Anaerolineales bacterium]
MPNVSLIMTVLNESQTIRHLLTSLRDQEHPPDEIVIVDGGSTDDTVAIIESYAEALPIRLLHAPGCNISQGRNRAIAAAHGPIIAATDAGVRIPPDWLARLLAPWQGEHPPAVVAGFFLPDPDPASAFQVAMSATVLPQPDEIIPDKFLPSSRSVAFTKAAWEAVGGYPEWLDYSEDLIFDLRLKARYGDFSFAPAAVVYFRPRETPRAFFKQYYRYARGDGKADLWRKRHAARYVTYGVLIPGLALGGWLVHPAVWSGYLLGGAVYLRAPYKRLPRLWADLGTGRRLLAILYVPVIRVVGDVAKMLGYPAGWRWRLQHRPPDWRQP